MDFFTHEIIIGMMLLLFFTSSIMLICTFRDLNDDIKTIKKIFGVRIDSAEESGISLSRRIGSVEASLEALKEKELEKLSVQAFENKTLIKALNGEIESIKETMVVKKVRKKPATRVTKKKPVAKRTKTTRSKRKAAIKK